VQTAAAFDAPVAIDARLREHDRATVPHFATREEYQAAVEAGFARPDKVVLGVESYAGACARVTAAIEAAAAEHAGRRLAIVTHGTVMALYTAQLTGADPLELWRGFALPHVLEL
jgi:2,3-bisphosphoglycerate-dependent phosphoglycerate mutase